MMTEDTIKKTESNGQRLQNLQRQIQTHYDTYIKGEITERQYLTLIRPLDRQIDGLELSALEYFISERSEANG